MNGAGRGGGGRFKANTKKDDRFMVITFGNSQGIQNGIDHSDVSAGGLNLVKAGVTSGHLHHVTEGSQDNLGVLGEGDSLINVGIRGYAHRAAGTGKQPDLLRQELTEAVLENGDGMGATYLH